MKNKSEKSTHGGKRPGAGRPKGALNKATADIKLAAREYTTEALDKLAEIMRQSQSDQAKVAAIRELLDRGYGKPSQAIAVAGDPDGPPVQSQLVVKFVGD